MTLAYAFVFARIYVRLRMRRERLKWADCWLLIALLSAQGLVICDTITYSMNAMDNFTVTSVSLDKVCNADFQHSALFLLDRALGPKRGKKWN